MGVWNKLEFYGKTTGVWEAGSKLQPKKRRVCGQARWDFKNKKNRKLGRGFYHALKRMGDSPYRETILDILKNYQASKRLTEKQWAYLGLLMNKADPACDLNPRIKVSVKEVTVLAPGKPILRKKNSESSRKK